MNIGLLQCDHVAERFQHIAGDYPEMFGALLHRHAPEITLQSFDVCNGEWPAAPEVCEGYLCTGSRHSVDEDIEWIHQLKNFVRQLDEADKPFVGICFGHQMLAEALGGKVAKAAGGWGVGVKSIEILQSENWMKPKQSALRLQYMHQDQVVRLPENSVLLGQSDHCPAAMFRVGQTMIGIQAHPEFTAAYCEALLPDRRERIGTERVQAALESLAQTSDEGVVAGWIGAFLNLPQRISHGGHGEGTGEE